MNVAEHWTSSRQALVVTADAKTVRHLVQILDLAQDTVVRVNQSRLAIALWGEDLRNYIRYRDDAVLAASALSFSRQEYASAS